MINRDNHNLRTWIVYYNVYILYNINFVAELQTTDNRSSTSNAYAVGSWWFLGVEILSALCF